MRLLQNAWFNFKNHMVVYTCAVYTLVFTLISIIIELGPTFQSADYWLEYSIFGVCMLSGAILFFLLVGLTHFCDVPFICDPNNLSEGVGASTFFMKLGSTVFAGFAIVLWGLEFFLAFASNVRPFICIFRTSLYILFHILQLIFVVNSSRMVFRLSKVILYFGFAHLLVVNLWTWMSLCVAKSGIHDENEVHHIHFGATSRYIPWVLHPTEPPTIKNTTFAAEAYKMRVVTVFGESAISFITCDVQFCLISAGVALSLFISTSPKHHERVEQPERSGRELISTRPVRHVGFDYENTSIGVALAVVMLIITSLSTIISRILSSSSYPKAAGITIGTFEIFFYTISIISCFILYDAIHKNVSGNDANREANVDREVPHQKIINIILLFVGAGGEIILCFVGILGLMNGSNGFDCFGLALATFIFRIIEVFLQSSLLLYLIRKGTQTDPCNTIGKQTITFLIGLNIILFGFHTAESTVQAFGFPDNMDKTHLLFLRIALPLVVFYRFHCSLCFAEIWKAFYDYSTVMAWSIRTSVEELSIPVASIAQLSTSQPPLSATDNLISTGAQEVEV